MNRIVISPRHLLTLQQHARSTYPEECCGILIGRRPEEGDGSTALVERILAASNDREDSRHNRYVIDPQTILAAQKAAKSADLDIVGYYHSHPDCPAVPSDFDREHAWPGLSYLIVSVVKGEVAETRSWQLTDDRESFDEETLDPAALRVDATSAKKRRAS